MTNRPWTILGNIFKAKERFSYPDDPNISTFLVIKWAVIPYNWDISRGTTYNQVPSSSFAITSMGSSDYINFITKQNYAWQYSELTLTFFFGHLCMFLPFNFLHSILSISQKSSSELWESTGWWFQMFVKCQPCFEMMIIDDPYWPIYIFVYIYMGGMMGMGGWTTHQLTYHRGLGEFWLGRRW